jgi:hypothetical protein
MKKSLHFPQILEEQFRLRRLKTPRRSSSSSSTLHETPENLQESA